MFRQDSFYFSEPAMLLMHNSIKTHPSITYGLLEFICKVDTAVDFNLRV